MTVVARETAPAPLGREAELDRLRGLVDAAGGAALSVRGGPGTGKTLLLDLVAAYAERGGPRVLRVAGCRPEFALAWGGLHRLLRPLLAGANALPAALSTAFGGAAADPFLVALATLDLLSAAGRDEPLLLLVDDAQWLDEETLGALAYVARRLDGEPVGLVVARRSSPEPRSGLDWPELRLGPLPAELAVRLLAEEHPDAPAVLRERWLREAAGNPLALRELPRSRGARTDQLDGVPLTPRLADAFASELFGLRPSTRALLLLLAADAGGTLAELLAAGARFTGRPVEPAELLPALDGGLVTLTAGRPAFTQPLLRWAIYADASRADRYRAHQAFVQVLEPHADDGTGIDRRVYHRAAIASGPDAALADALDTVAEQVRRRGRVALAARCYEAAAGLSADPEHRGRRLVDAAVLADQLGDRDDALRTADLADALPLAPADQQRVRLLRLAQEPTPPAPAVVRDAARHAADAAPEAASSLLLTVAEHSRWTDPGRRAREALRAAAGRLPVAERLAVEALAAPEATARRLTELLTDLPVADEGPTPGDRNRLLGTAAAAVGQFALAVPLLTEAARRFKAQHRQSMLAEALTERAWAHVQLRQWSAALDDATEAGRLARRTGRPRCSASSALAEAVVGGVRGGTEPALASIDRVEHVVQPHGAGRLLAQVQVARGLTLLTAGQYSEAVDAFLRLLTAGDPACSALAGSWVIGDLAEASVRAGRTDEVQPLIERVEVTAERTGSPRARMALLYARPLLAADDTAEALFRTALSSEHVTGPFTRSRLQLSYGEWLRRRRRVSDARHQLAAAHAAFTALGLPLWADRARAELLGSGIRGDAPPSAGLTDLTAAELQIARLAASGKSNRQIGEQLFLSHRTVSSHLYRIYPKLRISSRAQLHEVLARLDPPTEDSA
ncbi:AAA family ATPase [Cryptosporangium japonicum]|uniref:LuxR family transcriptional regulator n=1 Tax=Cryptosporangium japonicum TaxID=80872 RepID=A0ABN0UY85_9ACTN